MQYMQQQHCVNFTHAAPLKCETPACDDLPKVALVIYPGVFLVPEEYLDLANTLPGFNLVSLTEGSVFNWRMMSYEV